MARKPFVVALAVASTVATAHAAGPTLVKDIFAGEQTSFASQFTLLNGVAYFQAEDAEHGIELWRTDGTTAGTQLVTDAIRPGAPFGFPNNITAVNGRLYFSATDQPDGSGAQVWTSDGTAAGTFKLIDAFPGLPASPFGDYPANFTALNASTVLFTAPSPDGIEIYRTDGTAAGTSRVIDLHPGEQGSNPGGFTVKDGVAYFIADDKFRPEEPGSSFGFFDRELFRTDGTAAGTMRVKDINPGPVGSRGTGTRNVGGTIYFTADDGTTGGELWASDGTTTGTRLVRDITPGPDGAFIDQIRPLPGTNIAVFSADDGTGNELFRSDGTTAGTTRIKDINPDGGSFPFGLTPFGNRLVFSADDGVHGSEPWITDGTTAGTVLIADVVAGDISSGASDFTVVNDKLFFVTIRAVEGEFYVTTELWMSDGTAGNSEMIFQAPGVEFGYTITDLTAVGDKLLFMAPLGVDADGFAINRELYSYTVVPEPAGVAVLGLAGVTLLRRRRSTRVTE